jgi:uncharacterized protein YjbI with pentapeptide repeats
MTETTKNNFPKQIRADPMSGEVEEGSLKINRRKVVFGATIVAATTSHYAQSAEPGRRVSQNEFDEAVRLHGMWLTNIASGRRCTFAGRDLSGLKLSSKDDQLTNLSGADFSQADLSATEADNISLEHCNFNGASLDGSRWRRPVFAYADMRRITAKGAKWGVPSEIDSVNRVAADCTHTFLNNSDLTGAQICGFFYGSCLAETLLVEADLSFSNLIGLSELTFGLNLSHARLDAAKLRRCRIVDACLFNSVCRNTDFTGTSFSNVILTGGDFRGASFRDTQLERTEISPEQKQAGDFLGSYEVDS